MPSAGFETRDTNIPATAEIAYWNPGSSSLQPNHYTKYSTSDDDDDDDDDNKYVSNKLYVWNPYEEVTPSLSRAAVRIFCVVMTMNEASRLQSLACYMNT